MSWVTARLGEVTQILSGTTPDSGNSALWGGGHVWITPTDLGKLNAMVINDSVRRISDKAVQERSLPLVSKAAVVMSSRAPIGHLAIAGCDLYTNQGCKSFVCGKELDSDFLFFTLRHRMPDIQALGSGATFVEVSKSALAAFEISFPEISEQRQIAARLKTQLAEVETARQAAQAQVHEILRLADAIVLDSTRNHCVVEHLLKDVLIEVKRGIGPRWADYLVLGATRNGLAPAKEAPGKHAPKYKPAFPGTVFYNPMRILIGSIAFVDDDDVPGITSPDYVVLQGKPDIVDSRWFYYWLRSPLGVQCINSLARGAVRERMLFNRLAEGSIKLPDYAIQQRAAAALKELKHLRTCVETQLAEINRLPQRLLAQAFTLQGETR